MLLTNTLIAVGVTYTGVKIYKERQKKKETPWRYYAERVKKRRKRRKKSTLSALGESVIRTPVKIVSALAKPSFQYVQGIGSLATLDLQRQQLKEISSNLDEAEISQLDRKLNRDLTVASVSLGFATAGALIYAPLSVLAAPGLFWIGIVCSQNAYNSFKEGRSVGMDVLDVVFAIGCIATGNYFAGALGITFSRISTKLVSMTEDQSKQSLINVFGNQRRSVWLLKDGVEVEISVEALNLGDTIVVHAGEIIPVDGTITSGSANIDQHILTGEAQPAEKGVGDEVLASTVVLSGSILVEVEKAGASTVAAQIGEILNQTSDFKSSVESWGLEIGNKSSLATLWASGALLPFFGGGTALTILNSNFGQYMRVLGPLSMLTFLNLASQQGLLVKDGRSLQLLNKIDTVVFDKTGTLTLEQPHVGQIHTCLGISEEELLTYAAAAEYKQTHPIAKAILQAADERGLALPAIGEAKYEIGYGLKVSIPTQPALPANGTTSCAEQLSLAHELVLVGSARFMALCGIIIPPNIKALHEESQKHGHSFVYVAINDELAGAIELHATIRPEAKEVVSELRKRNMEMVIISGDHEQPTKKLAQELGIGNYFAETLPENKAELISKLQEEGKSVCFVGDGINDSIALKKANVSISLRGASSAATDSAQIILMNQNLKQLIQAFDVAQNFETNMKVNIMTTVVPGLITIYGAFFLGLNIAHSVILNDIGVVIGASNAIWPWLKERRQADRAATVG